MFNWLRGFLIGTDPCQEPAFITWEAHLEEIRELNAEWERKYSELLAYSGRRMTEIETFHNDRITALVEIDGAYKRHLENHIETLEQALRSK